MFQPFQPPRPLYQPTVVLAAQRAVEAAMRLLSVWLVPLGVALGSALILLLWHSHFPAAGGQPLSFLVVAENGVALTPSAALRELGQAHPVDYHDTRLSEAPLWLALHPREQPADGPAGTQQMLEFPSRHAVALRCWEGATLRELGSATRAGADGALVDTKAGFALRLPKTAGDILCRATFAGPARVSVLQWPAERLALSTQQFHRQSGLLDGGMIVLSLFVLVTALINRQVLYLQFAGWLFLNLRVAALSAGWDVQWLGQQVPVEWLLPGRALTMALYAVATLTLYMTLFGPGLLRTRFALPLRITQWFCLALLPCAIWLPYGGFLPVLWCIVAAGLTLMILGLAHTMLRSQSQVAMWFAASFTVTFMASLAEVFAAALGVRELLGVANSVTAALTSSMLAALAVAEQMRIETEQRLEAQEKLRHAYEAMPVGLFTLDMYGHFLSANPAMLKMLDIGTGGGDGGAGFAPGRTAWKQFFAESFWITLHEQVHMQSDAEMQVTSRDGSRCFMVSATLARGRIEAVMQDVTDKVKATEQLRFMADNDSLTKVFNWRGIEQVFEAALAPPGAGKPLSLAYIDLDRFKLINDLFGHAAGDEVLKQVCERMEQMLGGGQKIGRVGGDEFVIVMPDTAVPLATLICRGIVDRIGGTPYRVGDKAFHVRSSVGLIEVATGMPMKDAVSTADRACRQAKDGHSEGLVVYKNGSAAFQEREAELKLMARLSGPNATEGMFLEMQPIMSLSAPTESLNFEVLLRMREPDGRVCGAGPLIGAAEKSGRAGVIDRWVLSTTLGWIEDNLEALKNTRFVCMNLSGASLNDERFVQDTLEILARHAHVAARLCMEITESVALHDLANTRRFIDQVRNFGVKVALDDFGAGYTSFSYLKELPADLLKIDGNFVVNINAHPANVAIVEAIVNLAANLGMKTIAEWAEDADTIRTLAAIGVDYVQGFAIARSQPPEKLLAAASSASFIKSEAVRQVVSTLGASA